MNSDLLQMGVLCAIALATGLIGPFLVLRRMTMFANSLSHTILLGIGAAFLLSGGALFCWSNLLLGALFAALLTAFFTEGLIRYFRLQEDASIGLVFTSLFAAGICLVTLFMRDVHIGLEAVMGNAELLQVTDLKLALALALMNGAAVFLFYRQFELISFDRQLAKTLGIRCGVFHFLFLFLIAATCIAAFRAIGVLLVLSFLVGPYLTARLFCNRLRGLLLWTPIVGIGASILGVVLSRLSLELFDLPLSTAGIVSTLMGLIYMCAKSVASAKIALCEKKLRS